MIRDKIAPLDITRSEDILDFLAYARHPCFRATAVACNETRGNAMLHVIVQAGGQLFVTDPLHAAETRLRGTILPARERQAGAQDETTRSHESEVPMSCHHDGLRSRSVHGSRHIYHRLENTTPAGDLAVSLFLTPNFTSPRVGFASQRILSSIIVPARKSISSLKDQNV